MAEDLNNLPKMLIEAKDKELLDSMQKELQNFIESEDDKLHLQPMNSYFRRLLHKLANSYGLKSTSKGEDKNRHLVIEKTDETAAAGFKVEFDIAENSDKRPKNTYQNSKHSKRFEKRGKSDLGQREFLVPITETGYEVVLTKDGFVGFNTGQIESDIIDTKIIKSGSFKVVDNQIVET